MTGYDRVLQILEAVSERDGYGVRGNWRCPVHDDMKASLSLTEGEEGRALLHCHAGCETKDVVEALGLRMSDLFSDEDVLGGGEYRPGYSYDKKVIAQYVYTDEHYNPLIRVNRYEPKGFSQERWDDGAWVPGLKYTRRVLYNLPEVIRAIKAGVFVWIVEGEKDANALIEQGVVATTSLGGASNWKPEYNEIFRGAVVIIVADLDEPGRKYANSIRAGLESIAATVSICYPASGKDASDHLAAGYRVGDFLTEDPGAKDYSIFEPFDWENYETQDDEWLFRPFVPAGSRILLHGESGGLKSLWAMWLGARLALDGRKVAFFNTEMNKGQTAKRMRNLPRNNMKVFGRFMLGMDLEAAIRLFEGWDLLIIDSWSSAQGSMNSNDNDAISLLDTEFLQPLISATGVSVLILDNTGKDIVTSEGKVKQSMARGASRKRDIQEVELWFSRPDKDNNFRTKITCEKMRLDLLKPKPIVVETTQDVIEFYMVDNGMMNLNAPMWNVYSGGLVDVGGEEMQAEGQPSVAVRTDNDKVDNVLASPPTDLTVSEQLALARVKDVFHGD